MGCRKNKGLVEIEIVPSMIERGVLVENEEFIVGAIGRWDWCTYEYEVAAVTN